jgi:hypothetical protein
MIEYFQPLLAWLERQSECLSAREWAAVAPPAASPEESGRGCTAEVTMS